MDHHVSVVQRLLNFLVAASAAHAPFETARPSPRWRCIFELLLCGAAAACRTAQPRLSTREIADIYRVVLDDFAVRQHARGLIVSPVFDTAWPGDAQPSDRRVREALHDAASRRADRSDLLRLALIDSGIRVREGTLAVQLDSAERAQQQRSGGGVVISPGEKLLAIRALLPGFTGVIAFSPVGLSRDRSLAVPRVTLACGFNCGEDWLYTVERLADSWRIHSARMTTVA